MWRYVYRAVDNKGQIIDVFVSQKRDIAAATKFFNGALAAHSRPKEVVTDKAPALANVIEKLLPMVHHNTEQYANNRVECDHGRFKARLRSMRGLKTDRGARVVIRGHMFIQNLRRGHYELGTASSRSHLRVAQYSTNSQANCKCTDHYGTARDINRFGNNVTAPREHVGQHQVADPATQ